MQSEEAKKLRLEKRRKDTAHGKKHDELEELEEETEKLADQLKQVDQHPNIVKMLEIYDTPKKLVRPLPPWLARGWLTARGWAAHSTS